MADPDRISVSVIIPTHNRREVLRRSLDALTRQSLPADRFEVIVVADGCVDDTEAMVRTYDAPFRLRLVSQPASGPGAARNSGAAQATGRLLVFVDDDIEVAPAFVAAHLEGHGAEPRGVVLGYLPPVLADQRGLFRANLRMWWEDMFTPMRDPAYRFSYKNLLSGNFSVARTLFEETGGFDTHLRAHEDYELGYKLLKAGARFRFAEGALGYHHEKTDARRSLARKFDEGRADVLLGRRYPELLPTFPLYRGLRGGHYGRVQRMLFRAPDLTMALVALLMRVLPVLEACGFRQRWHRLLYVLQHGWYWRGVVAELPTRADFDAFLRQETSPDPAPEVMLDLQAGLEQAEARLDAERPASLLLWYGTYFVGHLPPAPGLENLRGCHLRPLLLDRFRWRMFVALQADQVALNGRIPTLPDLMHPLSPPLPAS